LHVRELNPEGFSAGMSPKNAKGMLGGEAHSCPKLSTHEKKLLLAPRLVVASSIATRVVPRVLGANETVNDVKEH